MARRSWFVLGATIGGLAIAGVAVWLWLTGGGLPWALRTALDRAGFENIRFARAQFANGVLTLEDVALQGVAALRVARIEATLGAGALRTQRIERLHLQGVRGRVMLGGPSAGAIALPPVDALKVDDIDVEIQSATFAVALSGAIDAERASDGFRIASRDARLRSLASPAWFVPLRIEATALWPRAEAPLALTVKGGDDSGALVFSMEGPYALNAGETKLQARLFPLVLIDEVRPVELLFPAARGYVEKLSGTVSGDFIMTGKPGAWNAQGSLVAKQVGVFAQGVGFENIDTTLRFDQLFPPALEKEQTIRIGRAVFALPFEDIVARFKVSRKGVIDLRGLEAKLAQGAVSASPLTIDPRRPKGQTTLTVENVSLSALLQAIDVEGLSGEGKLGGTLPIAASADSLRITGGVLAAVGPGRLRYQPKSEADAPADSQMAILRQVLTDFRYTELKLSMDGAVGGEQQVTVRLVGANPAFYDGYPVAFTLNVSGALEAIVRRGVSAYALPDTLRTTIERLQKEKRK
jgi:hypothetical protein